MAKHGFSNIFTSCILAYTVCGGVIAVQLLNQCIDPTTNATVCHENANCTQNDNSKFCICSSGFSGNGTNCSNIDECLLDTTCHPNASCIDTTGSFICQCEQGFSGNGTDCQKIEACNKTEHNCHKYANCFKSFGLVSCQCSPGFIGNGTFCKEAGSHANETMPCLKNSPCRNFNGTNSTLCHRNSSGSETNCTKTDKCLSGSICDQNAICIERNGSSSCTCKTGFSGNGTVCSDIDDCRNKSLCAIDRCKSPIYPCHTNAKCSVMNGTYSCTCKSGFTGNGTLCDNINECKSKEICHRQAICSDTEGSYKCQCRKGFVGNGTKCRDADECKLNAPCPSFRACVNTFGSYNCVDRCARRLCPRFSLCHNLPKNHICRCSGGRFKKKGRCVRAKQIFQVTNFALQRKFISRYRDTRSSAFTKQAEEIENALIDIYQRSAIAAGLGSVKIAKLERGSVIATYYLLYKRKTAYSLNQVAAVASNISLFLSLNPDITKSPVVRASSLCETGGHGCGRRATCVVSSSDAGYECRCKKRFEFRKGRCKKKRTFIEIIIPAVVGGILFLFFTCLLIVLLCKRKQAKQEEALEKRRNVIHIERLNRGNDNVIVSLEDTSQGIWRVKGKR
eukprot:Seg3372.1 transcript_id=Seg3372.1/GoldUCD/mRNA.D3Y31 product=Fibrillin-3 protein_id=Seg3372.1/GoldUCD/D3Y31